MLPGIINQQAYINRVRLRNLAFSVKRQPIQKTSTNSEAKMMVKHFLLLCMLATLLSVCYSCGGGGNGGGSANGGDSGGDGDGGDGGTGGNGGKRSYLRRKYLFSFTFQTFDVNKDGVITLDEFYNLQPAEHKGLFHSTDTDGNGTITCQEFKFQLSKFRGKAIC